MSTRGLTSANNIVQVDGMMINGLDGDGAVQQYINNAFIQEMTYQTAGAGADISPGGVRVNIVPRDGGNEFHGSFFGSWIDGSWQSNNLDADLRRSGLNNVDLISKVWDFNFGIGGPILRDKLWFYGSARHWGVHDFKSGTYDVPSGANVFQCSTGAVACPAGRGRSADQERRAAADLAGEPAQQDQRLLRRDRQVPRPRHQRRASHRHADGVADLDLAALQRRGPQVDQPAHQPAPRSKPGSR